jgi:hypothetical protein
LGEQPFELESLEAGSSPAGHGVINAWGYRGMTMERCEGSAARETLNAGVERGALNKWR